MLTVRVETEIDATAERCFDLARSQRAHVQSAVATQERIVSGPAHDLLEPGDEVTFEARHLGKTQQLVARIVEMDRPRSFVDEQVNGAFRTLRHVHRFEGIENGTRMVDELMLEAPFGVAGRIAERLFLGGYMKRFLRSRARHLKRMAESGSGLP
ncbi:SRPBCC family protein [Fimbriimonas ginsengisoli]|uniref:Cell division inhibitor SULA n=1 Tax=Fimbriimonas ginsengisoli Gsoil 348 TaxID=661478 RepID=A0A068NP78_FIMGI|nr:SRPBCC family protein [Fimbriimonas ginsengisoli]AIE83389.1 cell division inhibitor SULA [Fimbriimonas ginsengisoli Gsoil 348]